jgi:hypothetical protein
MISEKNTIKLKNQTNGFWQLLGQGKRPELVA